MRDIAARAGIDKKLIARYFGSKEALFLAALNAAAQKFHERATIATKAGPGERVLEPIFAATDISDAERLEIIRLSIYAAASSTGARLVRAHIARHINTLAATMEGKEPALRAAVVTALLYGIGFLREMLRLPLLVDLGPEHAGAVIAPALKALMQAQPSPPKRNGSAPTRRRSAGGSRALDSRTEKARTA